MPRFTPRSKPRSAGPSRYRPAKDLATCEHLTSQEVLEALEFHHTRNHLLQNPRLPAYLQFKMATSVLVDAQQSLAANPGLLPRTQLLLARGSDPVARGALARNLSLTQAAAEVLAWDEDVEVSRHALRNERAELTLTMPLHLHRWRPSYFGGSCSSAAFQEVHGQLPSRVIEALVRSYDRTWSFTEFHAFVVTASHLDSDTLEVLLEGFTGTPDELLELVAELGPAR